MLNFSKITTTIKCIYQGILFCFICSYFIYANEHQYPIGWDELQNDAGWTLIKETDRVKIFSKEISVSPIPAYKAEIISSVNAEAIMHTVWDVEKSTEVFPNAYIIDAGIYKKNNENKYTAFQLFEVPFISPRLYQFNSIRLQNSIHWVRTDTLGAEYNPENVLLPPVNFGSWEVEKHGDNTKLIYKVCTDPGGKIPKWIVKMANQKVLPQMLIDLEQYAIKQIESK